MCFRPKKKKTKKSKESRSTQTNQTNNNEKTDIPQSRSTQTNQTNNNEKPDIPQDTNNKENKKDEIISEKGNKKDREIINENIDEIENIENIESEIMDENEIIINGKGNHTDEHEREKLNKSFSETSHATAASKAALKVFTTSLIAAKPFFPWIEAVAVVIDEIVNNYDSVEYNKKTCLVLIERIEIINLSVKSLTRRREENQEKFQKEGFYHSFIKLHKVLKLVKEFIDDISELKGYRKFIFASDVKLKANNLLDRLDTCCRDLQFAIIITQETRKREQEYLDIDVANMTKFLKSIEEGVTHISAEGEKTSKVINRIYEEVAVIHQILDDRTKEQAIFNAPRINPKDLYDIEEYVSDNKLYKKLLRNTVPIACKILKIPEKSSSYETKKIKAQLSILNSIQSSNKIIKFHGTSQIGENTVLVFDWAEHGNLKRLYERESLSWVQNLQIAHDIASGLVFLQACAVLHHDIRCENILITGDARYEAKIANFHRSREQHELSEKITSYSVIRWLAPEKMPKDQDPSPEKYTFKCEIYSFGMLLWELCARRIPYKEKDMNQVVTHVMNKERESFEHFDNSNNNLLEPYNNKDPIIKSFIRIIEGAWAHERNQRPTINNIYQELDSLIEIHSPRVRPRISSTDVPAHSLPENIKNNNNNNSNGNTSESEENFEVFDTIISLEDGIKAHRSSERVKAWKCFETHASLGDPVAVYWKAYYYYSGYYLAPKDPKPNTSEAVKYFRQAADANIPEAQRYYAKALEKAKKPEYLDYYIKAADNDDVVAQRELGRIYYYGNDKVEKNKEKGIYYLKLAALKNNQNAINDLNKIEPDLLSLISSDDKSPN